MHLEFVKPASAFLLIHSEEPVDGSILGPVSTAYADIYRRGAFESNTELVDELLHSPGRYEVKHCVVKLPSDHSPEKVGQAIKELRLTDRPNVQIRLLRAVEPALISLTDDEYERTQFRREGAVDSQFVSHVDSCVSLVHLATGLAARSTAHRNRDRNFEEAIQLLAALLNGDDLLRNRG